MSELREECYKCLNNQSCPGSADYGSIICMTKRKYKMPNNEEDSIEYKTSDTNVGSIEKDIKRCEQLIKPEHASWIGISNQLAIAHLIEKIKELEEENKIYVLNGDNAKLEIYIKNNYIPVQKVKDLIKNETINISGFECIAVEDLKELLEEK